MRTRRAYLNDSLIYSFPYDKKSGRYVINKKFSALYGIFRETAGGIEGLCEDSFSLSWRKDRVALVSLEHAQKDYANCLKDGEKVFIARLSRRNGTIRIDWEKRHAELTERDDKVRGHSLKYCRRNAPFYT